MTDQNLVEITLELNREPEIEVRLESVDLTEEE